MSIHSDEPDESSEPVVSFSEVAAETPDESVQHEAEATEVLDAEGDPDGAMPDELMHDELDASRDEGLGFPLVGDLSNGPGTH